MEKYMLAAGVLSFVIGVVHSVLGEVLIFSHLRAGNSIVPTVGTPLLKERHVRIIWASWHAVTVFGCAFGAILLHLAFSPPGEADRNFIQITAIIAMLVCSSLVFLGTKGKHPGWLSLLLVAALVWIQ
jgi:hypothetical protein